MAVEQKALDDIKSGKTKMITQGGQEFLDDLQSIIDEIHHGRYKTQKI